MSRRAWILVLLVALGSASRADDHPNTARGFAADKTFATGEIDNVNLFSGNLTLTIPIGGSYPVGGGFSYGLTLVYNSNVWDFQEVTDSTGTHQQSLPRRTTNAGLGWTLMVARLMAPATPGNDTEQWMYLTSDGSEHLFYPTLHAGDADEPGDTPGVMGYQARSYTRDGSYMRMVLLDSGLREVELPNGEVHRFDSTLRLDQMRDRFGNALEVAYGFAGSGPTLHEVWTLSDTQGRVQKVIFETAEQNHEPYSVVEKVELTSFAGTTATYTFEYASETINRGCPNTDPGTSADVQVMLLTRVWLPDGEVDAASSFEMPLADYLTNQPATGAGCRTSGLLEAVKLPTGGRLEWTYRDYTFPSTGKLHRRVRAGVETRRMVGADGNVVGTWTYATSLQGTFPNQELKNTLTDPLAHRTERYFNAVYQQIDIEDPSYGLSFTSLTALGDKYLSTKTFNAQNQLERTTYVRYERDQIPTEINGPQDRMNVNRREISSRTVFDDDAGKYAEVTRSSFDGLGHYRAEATAGDFGAGNVRSTTVAYNPTRGRYEIDPATNQPTGNHDFTMWPADDPSTPAPLDGPHWILGTFDSRRVDEDRAEITKYCFNADTGFLEQQRTLLLAVAPTPQNPTPHNAKDLLAVFTANGNGNLESEKYYGGDTQDIAVTPCVTSGLPAPKYQIDHTYSAGVRATSKYLGTTFYSLHQAIDADSGLPSSSWDTAELQTDYEYDSLGRLTWIEPQAGDGFTEYVYTRATSTTDLAKVEVKRRTNSQAGTVLARSEIRFDAFGRVWKERELMPSVAEAWSVRETLYDAAGNRASVSERQAEVGFDASKRTQFLDYDPFGRPTKIRPADGQTHDVTLAYFGTRIVERTVNVRTTLAGAETASKTTERYDRQGRLWQVTEPSGAAGADVTTTYSYDAGSRLKKVETTAAGTTQERLFTYDVRGLLSSEKHPEKGATGNGQVTYSQYDARGHALRKLDGPNRLSFVFDGAERLKEVWEADAQWQSTLLLKSFAYASANSGTNKSQGKLVSASRVNYPFYPGLFPKVTIVETYTYAQQQGRVSKKTTEMFRQNANPPLTQYESFEQSYTYTRLGDVQHIDYPLCTYAESCPAGTPSPRSVDFTYTNGRLTAIPGYVTGITYHPNGLYNQITRANGVVDTQANDPNSMPRPASISAQRPALAPNLWSSGSYDYDGAGNVTAMGSSYFLYDKVSRIVDGHVSTAPTANGTLHWQTYSYDAFGNLTPAIASDLPGYGRSTPVDSAINHSTGTNVLYDAAGNQTQGASPSGTCASGNPCYEYDQFNMMRTMKNSGEDWRYMYTADDERAWSYRLAPAQDTSLWALRDLDGKVLREYDLFKPTKPARDYVYREGQLVASIYPGEGTRHLSLDHLGTPRLVTAAGGYTRGAFTSATANCKPAPADYDGDGDTDLSLKCGPVWHFYNDDGSFLMDITTGGQDSDIPAPADYDGDGDDDVVVFNNGAWHFYEYAPPHAYHGVWTGGSTPGCLPVPADYDNDVLHDAELSLNCGPAWHFYSDNGSYLGGIWTGAPASYLPVPGDYDGDGDADVVLSNGAAWNFFSYPSGPFTGGVWTGTYGTPMAMDYDGDGTTDLTVYANGAWHTFRDNGSYDQTLTTTPGAVPLRGNFGGDLTEEPATYSGGSWSIYSFAGMPVARHVYFPFGEELTSIRQDGEQMKLTGHERDLGIASSAADDLDYMHARHYDALTARFLSTDPLGGWSSVPQSWNRYAYVTGNPLKYVDPFGLNAIIGAGIKPSDGEAVYNIGFIESICVGGNDCAVRVVQQPGAANTLIIRHPTNPFRATVAAGLDTGFMSRRERAYAIFSHAAEMSETPAMAYGAVGGAHLSIGIGASVAGGLESLTMLDLGSPTSAWETQYAAQLEKQLVNHGVKSLRNALRSAERTLAEHEAKLTQIRAAGGHTSQVQRTIHYVRLQIQTLQRFMASKGL